MKKAVFQFTLWWAVFGSAIWVGGTVFMISVITPQWSRHPPDSVMQYFLHTDFNRYIGRFFGPPFMLFRSFIPQLLAVVLGWRMINHRKYLLISFGCTMLTIALTVFYIYPINEVLMTYGGAGQNSETIQRLTNRWILLDGIRFVIGLSGFFYLLRSFRLPI